MKHIIFVVVLMTGCVSNGQYESLAKSFDAYIRETKQPYLDSAKGMPQSVHDAKQHFVEDAENTRDKAFSLAGITSAQ